MPEEIAFERAWVRCIGPERHELATARPVRQLAHYVAPTHDFVGFAVPSESLADVRCPGCGYQVEPVTDERGFAARPPA